MSNEELNNEVELDPLPVVPEGEEDTTDYKELSKRYFGAAQRYKTKLAKIAEKPKEPEVPKETPVENKGLGYAELAFLTAKGIPDEDVSFVEETLKNTGKQLKDLLSANWFKAELSERAENRKTQTAIPEGTKRSAPADKTEKDYWLTKIREGTATLNDIPSQQLRRDVLNAKLAEDENKSRFAPQSVIIGGKN